MWHRLALVGVLIFLAACGSGLQQQAGNATSEPAFPARTRSPAAPQASVPSTGAATSGQDAWIQARAALPADVPLYKPAFVPERFSPPQLLEARMDPSNGPLYTIVYSTKDENLAFILNMGKGAFGNFPPAETNEPVAVLGVSGWLSISTETHAMGAFWQDQGRNYEIKAFSRQMTRDEMMRIVKSLALIGQINTISTP